MLRDFSHYLDQHGFVPDELAGRWRSSCSAGGIVGWYFSSATAQLEKLVSIQDSEGYGSDAHNPELLMAIAAADGQSVEEGKGGAVRVELGGRRNHKKKKKK